MSFFNIDSEPKSRNPKFGPLGEQETANKLDIGPYSTSKKNVIKADRVKNPTSFFTVYKEDVKKTKKFKLLWFTKNEVQGQIRTKEIE